MVGGDGHPVLELSLEEVLPERSVIADVRIAMFVSSTLAATAAALEEVSRASIRKKGYSVSDL
jgi:hypothetical protein